ncbi:MAG: polysaccharide biosynthesis C-terminal domain-containing protein, partial [Clostridia bacterium]|nr:polysaccharide biosynthesis C-terminal domain-containing protein [Clostridia bacterium]
GGLMVRDLTIGQYYPGDSLLHKTDPRVKIVLTLVFIFVIFFCRNFFSLGLMVAALLVGVALSRVPLRMMLKSMKAITFIIIITALLNLFYTTGGSELFSYNFIKITDTGVYTAVFVAVRILALVTPFMYIETVCDGVLKAVGEQKRTLGYTVLNSALRLALIFTLVKRYGGEGYLWLLVVSNTFSYVLCRVRLWRVTGAGANLLHGCVIPVLCAAGAGAASRYALRFLAGKSCSVCAAAGTVVYAAVFALLLLLFSGNRVRSAVSAFAKRSAERACGESP